MCRHQAAAGRTLAQRARGDARTIATIIAASALVAGCGSVAAVGPTPASSSANQPASAATSPASAVTSPATAGTALALQQDFVHVVSAVNPSVVVIETASGLGSGIVFDSKGDIVTNAHVTDGSTTFRVTLADGRTVDGTLVGSFTGDDLAVVHVSASGLQPATFADSATLAVGDIVLAIGNPLGLQSSVTEGIVSALGRTVAEENNVALPNTIQTSAAINPGNSGGALVDLAGNVVGIPTLAAVDPQFGGAATGIGFAISSNMVTDIARQLITNGKVTDSHRADLGVTAVDAMGAPGAVAYSVAAGGPAASAGIARGDAITSIDGKATPDAATLAEVLAGLAPGQAVKVAIAVPNGPARTVTVTLGQLPG
jgi:S1-C subfamily serine protease